MKPVLVWCGVDPKGRVMPTAIGTTRAACWWALVCCLGATGNSPKQAKAAGFTVCRFRLEEVKNAPRNDAPKWMTDGESRLRDNAKRLFPAEDAK